jgi:hypothetical protein
MNSTLKSIYIDGMDETRRNVVRLEDQKEDDDASPEG